MADSVLKNFMIKLSMDTAPLKQAVQDVNKTTNGMVMSLTKMLGAGLALKGLKDLTKGMLDYGRSVSNASYITGTSAEALQTITNATAGYGGSLESTTATLKALNQAQNDARLGGGALIDVARDYGIGFKNSDGSLKSTTDMLKSMAAQFEHMDRKAVIDVAGKLGIDDAMLLSMQGGAKGFAELIDIGGRFGVMTQDDIKSSNKFQNSLSVIKLTFKELGYSIARVVIPPLQWLMDKFKSFMILIATNKRIVVASLIGIGVALLPIIASMAELAISSVIAFAPFYGVAAVVAAIILVVEDLIGYFQGADSVTGRLAKKFPIIKAALDGVKAGALGLWDIFKKIWDIVLKLPDMISKMFDKSGELIGKVVAFFSGDDDKKEPAPVVPSQAGGRTTNISVNSTANNTITTNNPAVVASAANGSAIHDSVKNATIQAAG